MIDVQNTQLRHWNFVYSAMNLAALKKSEIYFKIINIFIYFTTQWISFQVDIYRKLYVNIRATSYQLFSNKRFELNFNVLDKCFNIAIFLLFENPCTSFFWFCPCYRPEHSLGKNIKLYEMNNEKN